MSKILKLLHRSIPLAVCGGLLIAACSKNKMSDTVARFDPSKPVTLQRFTPDSGGVGTQMIIYGDNFRNGCRDRKSIRERCARPCCGRKGHHHFRAHPLAGREGPVKVKIGAGSDTKEVVSEADFNYLLTPW